MSGEKLLQLEMDEPTGVVYMLAGILRILPLLRNFSRLRQNKIFRSEKHLDECFFCNTGFLATKLPNSL